LRFFLKFCVLILIALLQIIYSVPGRLSEKAAVAHLVERQLPKL